MSKRLTADQRKREVILVRIPRPEDHFSWGWIAWAAVSATGFAILEGHAIRRARWDRTLSTHWRRTFGIHPQKPWHIVGRGVVIFGCFWVAQHIAFTPEEYVRVRRYLNIVEMPDAGKAPIVE